MVTKLNEELDNEYRAIQKELEFNQNVDDSNKIKSNEKSDRIRVTVRFRPLLEHEVQREPSWQILPNFNAVTQINESKAVASIYRTPVGKKIPKTTFCFDEVYDEKYSTADIYKGIASSIVLSALDGFHGTIFAYGQTSSGKTYTMQGNSTNHNTVNNNMEKGVIQLALDELFHAITNRPQVEFLLRVSFIEVYNETVVDLLDPSASLIAVREHPLTGVYTDATERVVSDKESILETLAFGEASRHIDSTNINEKSSRSHSIFRLTVESRAKHGQRNCHEKENLKSASVRIGCLNFVDLAGSESVRYTGSTGKQLTEAGNINRSLLTLSRVISALGKDKYGKLGSSCKKGSTPFGSSNLYSESNDEESSNSTTAHINFRDSKLTRILKPSLSGQARVLFICCCTPSYMFVEETKSTLKFARSAKNVNIHASINEFTDDKALIRTLKVENKVLAEKSKSLDDIKIKYSILFEKVEEYEKLMNERNSREYCSCRGGIGEGTSNNQTQNVSKHPLPSNVHISNKPEITNSIVTRNSNNPLAFDKNDVTNYSSLGVEYGDIELTNARSVELLNKIEALETRNKELEELVKKPMEVEVKPEKYTCLSSLAFQATAFAIIVILLNYLYSKSSEQ